MVEVDNEMTEPDVCLLLEGTYPYVRGGVSSWIHSLVEAFPDLRFSIVLFGGARGDFGPQRYEIPKNIVHLETHYLADSWQIGDPAERAVHREQLDASDALHAWFREPRRACPVEPLRRMLDGVGTDGQLSLMDFFFGSAVWERVQRAYLERAPETSFIDYFWTLRMIHAPIFLVADVARKVPPARVYHAISTGFAGLLGVFLAHHKRRRLMVSEHGIYTKERKIDLAQADWIKDASRHGGPLTADLGDVRALWIRFFEGIGRLTYAAADPIVSLYEGNRQRQIRDGAAPERTRVIPNGIDLGRFEGALGARSVEVPKVAGLIGRVVPIKDIKTFIRAMQTIIHEVPDAEGWIVGPTDEDPTYAKECEELVEGIGLSGRVRFLGFQKVDAILPKLGVNVLSSISEAMPLTLLEGFAAGVPAVATDVGACREMIEGSEPEDRALGSAGAVVDIANPVALGRAVARLLADPDRWRSAQDAGLKRVRRHYCSEMMMARYRSLYAEALSRPRGSPWPE